MEFFGLSWVMPQRILELLAVLQGSFVDTNINFWRSVPHGVMFCL